MNLFVIYIGGMHEKSLIELHDMRFCIAEKIEDTYDSLKKSWWGSPESLHLDAWGILKYADGYAIKLENKPQQNSHNKLYFVNLGGYDKNKFTELHKNIFIVADNEINAKLKALKQTDQWESPHRDYQYEIDHILDITNIAVSTNVFIHLHPTEDIQCFEFVCRYFSIGKK